jgi:hypothetical protein
VWADYSPEAPETHSLILHYIYDKKDTYGLLARMSEHQRTVLTGHVAYDKFGMLFPVTRVLTFVREPLARLISEYKHFIRFKGYADSFNAFIRLPRNINMQAHFLSNVPISALGFVGLSEDYQEGLQMINAGYTLRLPALNLNKAPAEQDTQVEVLEEDVTLFKQLNQKDIQLYQQVKESFLERKALFQKGHIYTHGEYHIEGHGVVRGFAFQQNNLSPVTLLVEQNNKTLAEIDAKEFHPQMHKLCSPRKGYVGFYQPLQNLTASDAPIMVKVKDTGQPLLKV